MVEQRGAPRTGTNMVIWYVVLVEVTHLDSYPQVWFFYIIYSTVQKFKACEKNCCTQRLLSEMEELVINFHQSTKCSE